MKSEILISVIALVAAYTHLDDSLDFKALLENPPELLRFTHCILDKKDCDETGLGYRQAIGEAIETDCEKCTDYQKFTLYTYLTGLQSKLPHEYDLLKEKYDPDDVHIRRIIPVLSVHKDHA